MEDDSIYPNDGNAFTLFEERPKQKEARSKEKAKVLQAVPMLQEIIAHFDERIKFYDSVDSIPAHNRRNDKVFMRHWDANQLTRDNMRYEKDWLEGLIEDYKK